MLNHVKISLTVILSALSYAIGGWDLFLRGLVILMGIDYLLGIVVAGFFKRSTKTKNGKLNSYVGWVGLFKKVTCLLLIIVAKEIDILLGSSFVRTSTIIFFCINEIISITEHAGVIGLPVPAVFKKAIELLNKKDEVNQEGGI